MFHLQRRGVMCGAAVAVFAFAPCLFAQSSVFAPEYHHFTVNFGAGYTPVTGRISNYLSDGWNFQAGADYHPSHYFSIGGTFMFNGLGVKTTASKAVTPGTDCKSYSGQRPAE